MDKYQFVFNCTYSSNLEHVINEMKDISVEISQSDFIKIAKENGFYDNILQELGYVKDNGKIDYKMFKDDWCVNHYISRCQGFPVVYLVHSGIEYVFSKEDIDFYDIKTINERIDIIDKFVDENLDELIEIKELFINEDKNFHKKINAFVNENESFLSENNISMAKILDDSLYMSGYHSKHESSPIFAYDRYLEKFDFGVETSISKLINKQIEKHQKHLIKNKIKP